MSRDEDIVASYRRGEARTSLARKYSISGERVSQILERAGIPREQGQRYSRKQRVQSVYLQLVQYKIEHDGNTFPMRQLASLEGNHLEGVYVAVESLVQMGLVRRDYNGNLIIIGGKWIPPEEPNWEELL